MKLHSKNLIKLISEVVEKPFVGVEVGVYKGENSACLLDAFPSLHLIMVDLWKEWKPEEEYFHTRGGMGRKSQEDWNVVYSEAIKNTDQFDSRTTIYRMSSEKASSMVRNSSVDFVFLDAEHSFESVRKDMEFWIPKIRDRGLICGHDYGGTHRGVKKAVDERFGIFNVISRSGLIWGHIL